MERIAITRVEGGIGWHIPERSDGRAHGQGRLPAGWVLGLVALAARYRRARDLW